MKNTIDKHELTDKQIAACKDVEKAFKKARNKDLYTLTVQNL